MPIATATPARPRVRLTERVAALGERLALESAPSSRGLAVNPGEGGRHVDLPRGARVGPYRVIRAIGRGGMSVVYEARHVSRAGRVALKVARRDEPGDPQCRERLFLESLILERLDHPGIPALRDLGVMPDGRAWLAIDLFDGHTLTERLAQRAVELGEACALLADVAGALRAAHAAGVVHRDLKPDNVVLTRDGGPRCAVIDWGIARAGHLPEARITEVGVVSGTPLYMAPEQARGREVDGACDVYSLGVIAYEMLCGEPPFDGDSGVDILIKHIHDAPRPPGELRPDLPGWLTALVLAMLAKDPAARPSIDRVVATLTAPADGHGDDDLDRALDRVLAELGAEAA